MCKTCTFCTLLFQNKNVVKKNIFKWMPKEMKEKKSRRVQNNPSKASQSQISSSCLIKRQKNISAYSTHCDYIGDDQL